MSNSEYDERFFAVYASLVLGAGSPKINEIKEKFGDLRWLYNVSYGECVKTILLGKRQSERKKSISDKEITEIINYCEQNNIRIITESSPEYIYRLKTMENSPAVIYLRGEALIDRPAVAIVGTRKPTEFGLKAAYSLSARLSLSGFEIVSGGAVGIDSMAHYGAINSGGKTVMVLGCGIDGNYLSSQNELRIITEKSGTVISELPPRAMPYIGSFPMRNRIISVLSDCVAVVEAGAKSGALITANYAMEQGRELFCIPGSINIKQYEGSNLLIRDGATPLISANDIIDMYSPVYDEIKDSGSIPENIKKAYNSVAKYYADDIIENKRNKSNITDSKNTPAETKEKSISEKAVVKTVPEKLECGEDARKVYSAFESQTESADVLSIRSGISGGALISALSELEIMGYIKAVPVGMYKLIQIK